MYLGSLAVIIGETVNNNNFAILVDSPILYLKIKDLRWDNIFLEKKKKLGDRPPGRLTLLPGSEGRTHKRARGPATRRKEDDTPLFPGRFICSSPRNKSLPPPPQRRRRRRRCPRLSIFSPFRGLVPRRE